MQIDFDQLEWTFKAFQELTLDELYDIMVLRQRVFVVEQECPFVDADNHDQPSLHLFAHYENQMAAYARIIPPGMYYKEPSVGRIVTAPEFRGTGLGKLTTQKSIDWTYQEFGKQPIRIMAQHRLMHFYHDFGFKEVGERFLEDDIWHIEMVSSV